MAERKNEEQPSFWPEWVPGRGRTPGGRPGNSPAWQRSQSQLARGGFTPARNARLRLPARGSPGPAPPQ